MEVVPQHDKKFGAVVHGFDWEKASEQEIADLKQVIYGNKIAILKNQSLEPKEYLAMGKRLGEPEKYYQPMYYHPEAKEIFVSSNVPDNGHQIGVPRTGKFWHADYAFMPRPFAFTMIYPQVIPTHNRGTYFINMSEAFETLPDKLKETIEGGQCHHSVRRFFKIRPTDVYRPVSEILEEIERETPPTIHPTTFNHPITGEKVLYISEGFTYRIDDADGNDLGQDVLSDLLKASGQLDKNYSNSLINLQTFERGDLLVWDNRSLVHCAQHSKSVVPSVSYRLTLHDDHTFC
ncbi:MAG: TauD/TfdA family dioxygenase [Pseudomonadota bacterium]